MINLQYISPVSNPVVPAVQEYYEITFPPLEQTRHYTTNIWS